MGAMDWSVAPGVIEEATVPVVAAAADTAPAPPVALAMELLGGRRPYKAFLSARLANTVNPL